jgi:hypothetical protein
MSRFAAQRLRASRRKEALASGIRLVVRGGVLGLLALVAAYAAPPEYFTLSVAPLAALGALIGGFGALKVFASTRA